MPPPGRSRNSERSVELGLKTYVLRSSKVSEQFLKKFFKEKSLPYSNNDQKRFRIKNTILWNEIIALVML